MSKEEEFKNLMDFFKNIPENFNILEEQIDLDIQKEFFDLSQNLPKSEASTNVNELSEILFTSHNESEIKKSLVQLANLDSIEAYKAILKYKDNDGPLKMWSVLAEQQSRMVLQSSMIDEEQVFISTGLGGKGNKLRYFFIFPFEREEKDSTNLFQRLQGELEFSISKELGEIEEMKLNNNFITALCLLPIKASIPEIISNVLEECTQLGFNLSSNIMITNMKKLSKSEIEEIIAENQKDENPSSPIDELPEFN